MRTFTLVAVLILLLPACALLDAVVGTYPVHASDESGAPLYLDPDGRTTTDAHGPDGPNTPLVIDMLKTDAPAIARAAENASRFGPWGALAGGLATLVAGVYARSRNRQRLHEAGLREHAEQQLDLTGSALTFAVQMVEKLKEGRAVPTDAQGRVNVKDLKRWVFEQGGRFEDPQFLAEVVRVANASLPGPERRQALRALPAHSGSTSAK